MYGFLISLGIYFCLVLAEKKVKEEGNAVGIFWNVSVVALLCGLIGARLYHIVDFWNYYSADPIKILFFWNGGLGILGGILGTIFGLVLYLNYKKLTAGYWLDLFATFAPLAQAIGRWGNYINQEIFGKPTSLPWGIFIDSQHRPPGYEIFSRFHPLFFYESTLDLALFFILLKMRAEFGSNSGLITAIYLLGYAVIRFCLEFIKLNPWRVYGVNVTQAFCIVIATFSLFFIVKKLRKNTALL